VSVKVAGLAAATALALVGCSASRPALRPPKPPVAGTGEGTPQRPGKAQRPLPVPLAASEYHEEPEVVGVTHVVRKGETVYRIARAYGIAPDDLLEVNGIADPRQVAVGTELFVPGASRVVDLEEVTGGKAGSAAASTPPPAAGSTQTSASSSAATAAPVASATATPRTGSTSISPGEPPAPRAGARLAWPLQGVLYGRYGVRAGRRHDGIDLAAPEGTPIGAAAAGTVIYAGEQSGYGSIVILRHADGLVTLYAHCSVLLVDEGREVRRGEPIAKVGQTGRTSGPHLHFEVREGTRPRNPLLFLP
jgi:murein DD-endopeptidase MepM/ murein hydrolase activator NlpD